MYVSDRIVYLQMQKTGCTHITKVLCELDGGSQAKKHDVMVSHDAHKTKHILSSIRNPWSWYVSLWAYGCSGQGQVFTHLTRSARDVVLSHARRGRVAGLYGAVAERGLFRSDHRAWREVYGDASNPANFRRWLKMALGGPGKAVLPEGYARSGAKEAVGLMTYRFLQLCTEHGAWTRRGARLRTRAEIERFFDEAYVVDDVVRIERLNADLAAILRKLGIAADDDRLEGFARTNASAHGRYRDYYDDETVALVATRDALLIERFDYEFAH